MLRLRNRRTAASVLRFFSVVLKGWGNMFARMKAGGRLFDFDLGDWSMLLTGLVLAAFLSLLV
jgi:hypothetical protein